MMKLRSGTLFFVLALLVALPTSQSWACGKHAGVPAENVHQTETEKPCCKDRQTQNPDYNCPCDHVHGDCHCPGCGTVSGGGASAFLNTDIPFLSAFPISDSDDRQAFYFADHLPEAVYLPIWQPPKLSV